MASVSDSWFVRLPDGRVVLAKSTKAVRYHIETGRIPGNSRVRRHPEEDWSKLEWAPEFADLLTRPPSRDLPAPIAAKTERPGGDTPNRTEEFRAIGVGNLVNELFTAVDSSLQRYKLWIAA